MPPAFSAPDPTYAPQEYPATAYPPPAYAPSGYGGYGGYGVQPQLGYPVYAPQPKTNGLAIASMVVSIVGATFLVCYGIGGLLGVVGAILGHVARKQIRERQEAGNGMALAGVIVGWIATGLALIVVAVIVGLFAWAINNGNDGSSYDSYNTDTYNTITALLAR